MQRVATETNTFSPADFVGLASALVLLVAFVIAPWFVSDGSSFTGSALLSASESPVPIQTSVPLLLAAAGVLGGLAALWGVFDARARRISRNGALVAGLLGLFYYGIFLFENSPSTADYVGAFIETGFWVGLLAVIGLLAQVALPRPHLPLVRSYDWRKFITITRTDVFSVFFVLVGAWILLAAPATITGDTTTFLSFDPQGSQGIQVATLSYSLVVGALYLASGVVGLLPVPSLKRWRSWLLFLCGILIIPTVLIIAAAGQRTNVVVMTQESLRLATPIVLGALAGLWCERAGVVNIAIEGMMLTGAAFGFVSYVLVLQSNPSMNTQQAQLIGVVVAVLSGGLMAALHAWLSITFRTDQIVSGTVINILAIGLTSFIRREVLVSADAARGTLSPMSIPGLSNIPVVGEIFFTGKPIFYGMFILLMVTHIVLYYTRWGLRTRAVGENPHAADTLGINVIRNRWINVIIGGLIAGLAGAWFSLETTGSFDDQMTAGRGFIALAAMIFGKWTPIGAFGGGLLFGFSDALGQRFQFLGVAVPPQFLQMVPYVITIVVLAGLIGKANPPKADGVPFNKE
jgi:simple sugar transport system permease protein